MNVSKITVGRLFNLGNYEHVKFEVEVQIAEKESAGTILSALETCLNDLSPVPPDECISEAEQLRLGTEILEASKLSDEEFNSRYGCFDLPKDAWVAEKSELLARGMRVRTDWEARRKKAIASLNLNNLRPTVTRKGDNDES